MYACNPLIIEIIHDNCSQPQSNTTISNKKNTSQQQTGKQRKHPSVNQQQLAKQTTSTAPPSAERPGPEGEAEEEEPSEVGSRTVIVAFFIC